MLSHSSLALLSCSLYVASSVFPLLAIAQGTSQDQSSSSAPNLRAKSLILTKIWCLIIVFLATFLGGVSPYFFRWDHGFLVLGTQFAGGVFLGTSMMHFLSDSTATFQARTTNPYPFSFMLACAGYLLTMWGDCLIQYIFVKEVSAGRVDEERGKGVELRSKKAATIDDEGRCECCEYDAKACKCQTDTGVSAEARTFVKATLVKTTSFGDTILLILALCFHSVFEGIAIGVAQTSGDAWKALWTISLHKIFAAIAMGIALLRMVPDRPLLQCAAYAFAFAISSPIGVAIGIIIDATTQGPIADWIYAIAMGLACGIFIYVAINHLLAKGYVPDCKVGVDTPFYKFLAATLGVGVIAVVMIWGN